MYKFDNTLIDILFEGSGDQIRVACGIDMIDSSILVSLVILLNTQTARNMI